MRRRHPALAVVVVAAVVVSGLSTATPAYATGGTSVQLDSGTSAVPVTAQVRGASASGVLLASGGYSALSPALRPGSQQVIVPGVSSTTLPAQFTASGYQPGTGLIGDFATSDEYVPATNSFAVAYRDAATPAINGLLPLPGGITFVSGGPHGWVEYNDATRTVTYVQPTGGTGDSVSRTTLLLLGQSGFSYQVASAGASTDGVLINATCNNGCTGSVLDYVPFADPTARRTLVDPAAAFAAPAPVGTLSPAPLSALACPSALTCLGIDGNGSILSGPVDNPGTWVSRALEPGHVLTDLSCAGTTLCVAVDQEGNVFSSATPLTLSSWSAAVPADPAGFVSVSCATTTLCVGVDYAGQVVRSTNPTGDADNWVTEPGVAQNQSSFTAISCPSTSLCVAVDSGDVNGIASAYVNTNPAVSTTWTRTTMLNTGAGITDVACPDATHCYATDGSGQVSHNTSAAFTGWSATSVDASVLYLPAITCTSASNCVVADASGSFWHTTAPLTGPWTASSAVFSNPVRSLVCGGSLCLAGGNDGGLATSNDSGASFSAPTPVTSLIGSRVITMSCPSATACFSLDDHQGVSTSTDGGASWATSVPIDGFPDDLDCPTSTACITVNGQGLATTSSTPAVGGSWTPTDTGDTDGLVGVDCASTSLCVAFDQLGSVIVSTNAFTGSPTWSAPHNIGSLAIADLTCPSALLCVAVDFDGKVLTSTSPATSTWAAGVTPAGATGFSTVSCPTTTQCLAGTGGGALYTSVNPTGGAAAWVAAGALDIGLSALSCPTTSLCMAIGYGGTAVSATPLAGASSFTDGPTGLGASESVSAISCVAPARCVLGSTGGHSVVVADALGAIGATGDSTAIDDAGDAAWVTHTGSDGSGREVRRFTTTAASPYTAIPANCVNTLAITPGRTFWIECDGSLVRADGSTTTVVAPSSSYVTGLSATGTTAYYSLIDGSVHSLDDASTSTVAVNTALGNEPVSVRNLALSPGRTAYTDDAVDGSGPFPSWSRTLSNVAGNLTAGVPSVVAHATSGPSLSISGTRTLAGDDATGNLTLLGGASPSVVATTAQLGGLGQYGYADVGPVLSGLRALYPVFVSGVGITWKLYDVSTGLTSSPVGAGSWTTASLSGQYLAFIKTNGEVDRLDLKTNATTVVSPAPVLGSGQSFGYYREVSVSGTSVAWLMDVRNADFSSTWSAGYETGGTVHPLTVDGGFNPDVRISHQYVVSSTSGGAGLSAIRLSDGASVSVPAVLPGAAASTGRPRPLALDGNLLAYQGADGFGHVDQLPAVSPDVPVTLGASTPTAYTTGSGRQWQADIVTSAPLTTCSWAITQGATAVRTLPCDAADMAVGEARANWDGKNGAAAAVANGSYTWTLTAAGDDGAVPTSELSALTGSIAVSSPAHAATFTAAPNTSSAFAVTFDRDVFGANSADVKLMPSTNTTALGTTVRCYTAGNVGQSCALGSRKVTVTPVTALVPGASYRLAVNSGTAALVDVAGAPVTPWTSVNARIRTADDRAMSQSWAGVADTHAIGGSYLREHRLGAAFSRTFTGTGVRYWYVRGPDEGKAKVLIDGVVKDAALDEYNSTRAYKSYRTYTGLSNATHTLTVLPLGTRRTGATDTFVSVDAMSLTSATCATTTGCTVSPSGSTWATHAVTGGSASVSDVAGALLVRTFFGTGFDLYRQIGPGQGQMGVIIDGHPVTINNYSATNGVAAYTRTGLTNTTHTLQVKVLHVTGKAGISAFTVMIDRVVAR